MAQRPQLNMVLDPVTRRRLTELAERMGGLVKPLPISDVVRECVRRVHESEVSKTKEKRR